MSGKHRALWVEDGANFDLRQLAAPVYMSGRYYLSIAEDVSAAVRLISEIEFDAIVVDVRLPPGLDPAWILLYKRGQQSMGAARLGIAFLESCLTANPEVRLESRPGWLNASRFGIFSVETQEELSKPINQLSVSYMPKSSGQSNKALLEFLDKIVQQPRST